MLTGTLLADHGYRMLGLLGQGGQSRVYLVLHEATGTRRVIKCLRPDAGENTAAVYSFRAEAAILRAVSHPCLPALIEVIDDPDAESPMLVLEYIEGTSLLSVLRDKGPQTPEDIIRWGMRLSEILTWLHAQSPPVIYRDLKPGNIILRPDGDLALIDFGSARRMRKEPGESSSSDGAHGDTVPLGTRGYAAPEQFGGHGQSGPEADIYGLGATLYHLLTGQHPAGPLDIPRAFSAQNSSRHSDLQSILCRCTAPEPSMRYASAVQVREALSACRRRQIKRVFRVWAARAAVCLLLCIPAVLTGLLARSQIADAMEKDKSTDQSTERENMSETQYYLELSRKIRENTMALQEAGISGEELEEILNYIDLQLEDAALDPAP